MALHFEKAEYASRLARLTEKMKEEKKKMQTEKREMKMKKDGQ